MSGEAQQPDSAAVREHLEALQDQICQAFEDFERAAGSDTRFDARTLENERGGVGRPRVLSDGLVFERAAVNSTYARGPSLPPAATADRPQLAGRSFEAVSLSLITHPVNPYVPTSHANWRFFIAYDEGGSAPLWWFGGGFDLTPYYPEEEDVVHWHRTAKASCDPFGADLYRRYKEECDEYFHLPHRGEARGVGGLFFDDLTHLGDDEPNSAAAFSRCFAFVRSVSEHYLPAYLPIVERRKGTPYGERHRDFQLYRRGRYAEFNLAFDRGTRYGLQAGARAESVLASMPPRALWRYDWSPETDSEEARLERDFLPPRDWV